MKHTNELVYRPPRRQVELLPALAIAAGIALIGGMFCGWSISRYGQPGAVAFWGIGAAGGFVANRCVPRCQTVACLFAISIVVAMFVADTAWIHWNTIGSDTWTAAASKLTLFYDIYNDLAEVSAAFTLAGVIAVYRQTA